MAEDSELLTAGKALEMLKWYENPGYRGDVDDFPGLVKDLYETLVYYEHDDEAPSYVYNFIDMHDYAKPDEVLRRSEDDEGVFIEYDLGDGMKKGKIIQYLGDSLQYGHAWETDTGDVVHETDLKEKEVEEPEEEPEEKPEEGKKDEAPPK